MPSYVSTYFSPGRGAADVIIGFIDRCTETIDAAIYSLTHDAIAEALIRAVQRGVKVRVLTDYMQATSQYADDEKLGAAGVQVRVDNQNGAMHNKFLIGDSFAVKTGSLGSFNWTKNANERNAENFVIIRLKYAVAAYQVEFDRLWELNAPIDLGL
jgi:phosphatidylserine/phosphatidylglycerophosphate/cardiolipin synthase-like enzyme